MYLPEFDLLLPIDEKSMDVFSLGKEAGIKARWHCVIEEGYADAIRDRGVFPQMTMPVEWITFVSKIKIQLPHTVNCKKKVSRENGKLQF